MKKLGLIIFVVCTTLFVACDKKGSHGNNNVCGNGYPVNNNYATTPAVQGTQPNPWAPVNPAYNNPNGYDPNCAGVYPNTGLPNFYPQNAQNSMTFQPQIPGCTGNLPIFNRGDMASYCSWLPQAKRFCPAGAVDQAFQQACGMQVTGPIYAPGRPVICVSKFGGSSYVADEPIHDTEWIPSRHESTTYYPRDEGKHSTPVAKPAPQAPVVKTTPAAPGVTYRDVVGKSNKQLNLKDCLNIQEIHDYIVEPTHGTSSLAVKYLTFPSVQGLQNADLDLVNRDVYGVPLVATSDHDEGKSKKTGFGNSVIQDGASLIIDDQVGTIYQCDSNLRLMWVNFVDSATQQKYVAQFSLLLARDAKTGKSEKSKPNPNFDPVIVNYNEGSMRIDIDASTSLSKGEQKYTTSSFVFWSHNSNLSNVGERSIDGKLYAKLKQIASGVLGTKKDNKDRKDSATFEGIEANTKLVTGKNTIIDTK